MSSLFTFAPLSSVRIKKYERRTCNRINVQNTKVQYIFVPFFNLHEKHLFFNSLHISKPLRKINDKLFFKLLTIIIVLLLCTKSHMMTWHGIFVKRINFLMKWNDEIACKEAVVIFTFRQVNTSSFPTTFSWHLKTMYLSAHNKSSQREDI